MLLTNAVTNVLIVVLSINTVLLLTSIANIIAYAASKPLFVEVPTTGIGALLYITRKYKDRKSMKWGLLGYAVLFMISTHLCTLLVPIFHPVKSFYTSDKIPGNFPIYRQFDVSTGRNAFELRSKSHILETVAKDYCNLLSNCSAGDNAGLKPVTLTRLSDVPPRCNDSDLQHNVWFEYCLQEDVLGVNYYYPAVNVSGNGDRLGNELQPPICTYDSNYTQICDYKTKYNISGKFNTTHKIDTSKFYNLPAWTIAYPSTNNNSDTLPFNMGRLSSIKNFGISGIDNPTATLYGGWFVGNYVDIMHGSSNTSHVYSVTVNRLVFDINDDTINITDVSHMIGYDILPYVKNLNKTSFYQRTGENELFDTVLTYNVSVDMNHMSGNAVFQVASSYHQIASSIYNQRFIVIDTWNSSFITYASYTSWDKFDLDVDNIDGAYIGRPLHNRTFVQPIVALWLEADFPNSSDYIDFKSQLNNWTTITDEAASLIIPLTTPSRTKGEIMGSTGYEQYGITFKEVIASSWSIIDIIIVVIYCAVNLLLFVYVNYRIPKYYRVPLWRTAINTDGSEEFDLKFVSPTDGNSVALLSNNMVITATAVEYTELSISEYKRIKRSVS